METTEVDERATSPPDQGAAAVPSATAVAPPAPAPRPDCPTCAGSAANGGGGGQPAYVYALGRIEVRFPSIAIEKEFAQATGRENTAGLTDRQALHSVLTQRQNRYLARRLCWVLTIEGIDTYILASRDPVDFELLLEHLRPASRATDYDAVIGVRGGVAPPEACNGLMLPIVTVDQTYSFDIDGLIKSIPRPESMTPEQFEPAAEELFTRFIQVADNAGATDEHRALNYLALRYPAVYARATEAHANNFAMTGVEVRPSRLSGLRKIVDVVFSYTQRQTDFVEKYFVRVDVTEEFPFLVTKMSPYYER
jgi:hypothetical protein